VTGGSGDQRVGGPVRGGRGSRAAAGRARGDGEPAAGEGNTADYGVDIENTDDPISAGLTFRRWRSTSPGGFHRPRRRCPGCTRTAAGGWVSSPASGDPRGRCLHGGRSRCSTTGGGSWYRPRGRLLAHTLGASGRPGDARARGRRGPPPGGPAAVSSVDVAGRRWPRHGLPPPFYDPTHPVRADPRRRAPRRTPAPAYLHAHGVTPCRPEPTRCHPWAPGMHGKPHSQGRGGCGVTAGTIIDPALGGPLTASRTSWPPRRVPHEAAVARKSTRVTPGSSAVNRTLDLAAVEPGRWETFQSLLIFSFFFFWPR
jgi:hypothetical protein